MRVFAVVAAAAALASVTAAPSTFDMDLGRLIGADLTRTNGYGAPIAPWRPGAHPGWYYGHHPEHHPHVKCLKGPICHILDWFPHAIHCPKPPPKPPVSDGYQQTFANLTGATQASDYMTFGLVDTVADCKAMCNSVAGCKFVNTYHDVNGKDGSTQLTCSLFSICHTSADATNTGGQTQPDGSINYIRNSDVVLRSLVMDGQNHLLSLKVMRISRPELASAWEPFYSSSPSFSARSTTSVLSLQGTAPLPGHPKTLRDLTHASQLLVLPSSFGSIQLGETFACCLCINNEAQVDAHAANLKVEMQTSTSKIVLAEFGGQTTIIHAGETYECSVSHDIKELGQHVLACTVNYQLPQDGRQGTDRLQQPEWATAQTFRKFYKFAVTNPLSVRTKAHAAKSASALMSVQEREKVFLETHLQNLTQEPMLLQSLQFECVEGWEVIDPNTPLASTSVKQGTSSLLYPQDIRQFVYILSPTELTLFLPVHPPGSVIPLGRLEIFWKSQMGEPGHLLTSTLSRRVPAVSVPVQQPVPAVPPYLRRALPGAGNSSRPQSPQPLQSRPGTPPATHSPRNRASIVTIIHQEPAAKFNLSLTTDIPKRHELRLGQSFDVSFCLRLLPPPSEGQESPKRVVKLAVQRVRPKVDHLESVIPMQAQGTSSPPLSSGFSTPSSSTTVFNYAVAHQKLLHASRDEHAADQWRSHPEPTPRPDVLLPKAVVQINDPSSGLEAAGVITIGPSAVILPDIMVSSSQIDGETSRSPYTAHFQLSYLARQRGLHPINGLRVFLVKDEYVGESDDSIAHGQDSRLENPSLPLLLKEWNTVAEVWIS